MGTHDVKDTFVDGIYQEQSTGCGPATSVTKYYMAFGRVITSRVNGKACRKTGALDSWVRRYDLPGVCFNNCDLGGVGEAGPFGGR